tara:strand:+ start:53 stop:721 length:669 start_codon:yes stop_codon:yes gene_type:complete
MDQNEKKESAAKKALELIKNDLHKESVLGIGTGSTTNLFIKRFLEAEIEIKGVVCSSLASENLFKGSTHHILSLNDVYGIDFYIDGADEFNERLELIKGGGAALTREKILAHSSSMFFCIVDDSKKVEKLGRFPLPIEVIEIARSAISREVLKMGGKPVFRKGITTDNGNQIIDVHNLNLDIPYDIEGKINNIPGVVENGIFAKRKADKIILSTDKDIQIIQ